MTEKQKFIDLDAFVPEIEPSFIKINGHKYKVVDEISVGTYLRMVKMEELRGKEADENLIAIFQEAIPDLQRDIITGMTGPQLTGCITFLINLFTEGASDPKRTRPMLEQIDWTWALRFLNSVTGTQDISTQPFSE